MIIKQAKKYSKTFLNDYFNEVRRLKKQGTTYDEFPNYHLIQVINKDEKSYSEKILSSIGLYFVENEYVQAFLDNLNSEKGSNLSTVLYIDDLLSSAFYSYPARAFVENVHANYAEKALAFNKQLKEEIKFKVEHKKLFDLFYSNIDKLRKASETAMYENNEKQEDVPFILIEDYGVAVTNIFLDTEAIDSLPDPVLYYTFKKNLVTANKMYRYLKDLLEYGRKIDAHNE